MYGVDVSHYQGNFDFHQAAREGSEFAILKATEGHTWVDKTFARNLRKARAAGLIVAAYHYQRGDSGARAQAAHIASVVPRDVPVILDVEDGGGGPDLSRAILGHLHDDGYRSPLIYLPAWYWRRIGEPSLAGLPPLWYSRYASNEAGTASELWNAADEWYAQFWDGYGGLHVEILQYSSHARVAGTYPVDANFYRGDRAQLAALFGSTHTPQEGDVSYDDAKKAIVDVLWREKHASRVPDTDNSISLADGIMYGDAYGYQNLHTIRRLEAEQAAQTETIRTLAQAVTGSEFDADELIARIGATVRKTLAESTVQVDVNVKGQEPQQ